MKNILPGLFGFKSIKRDFIVKKYKSEKVLKYFQKQRIKYNIKEDIFYNKDKILFQFTSFCGEESLRIASNLGEIGFSLTNKKYKNNFRSTKYFGTNYNECKKELLDQIEELNIFLKSLNYKMVDEAIRNPFNSIGEKTKVINI